GPAAGPPAYTTVPLETPTARAKATTTAAARTVQDLLSSTYAGTCTTTGAGRGRVRFTCNLPTALDGASCAEPTDPGLPVQTEFPRWQDLSTRVGITTPRRIEDRALLWKADGTAPRTNKTTCRYDTYGNVTLETDAGDVADPNDDLTTTRQFAVATAP